MLLVLVVTLPTPPPPPPPMQPAERKVPYSVTNHSPPLGSMARPSLELLLILCSLIINTLSLAPRNHSASLNPATAFSVIVITLPRTFKFGVALRPVHRNHHQVSALSLRTATSTFTQLLSSVTSTETIRLITILGTGSPGRPPRLLTQLEGSITSTETTRFRY